MNPVLEEIFADELKQLKERSIIDGEKKGIIIGEKRGIDKGITQGITQGIELTKTVLRLSQNGYSPADIVSKYNITEDIVRKVLR